MSVGKNIFNNNRYIFGYMGVIRKHNDWRFYLNIPVGYVKLSPTVWDCVEDKEVDFGIKFQSSTYNFRFDNITSKYHQLRDMMNQEEKIYRDLINQY
jgi:hypothetical protein